MSVRLVGSLVSGAVLGKLLGLAREIEMARLVGANIVADSFRGAMTAVLLPVAPLQSDILPSVLIPLHKGWQEQGDAARRSAAVAVLLTILAALVAAGVHAVAAPWVGMLVGGFDAEAQALTVRFVKVMSLAIPASVLSTCLGSIEIAAGTARIAAIRASCMNLCLMAGIAVMAVSGRPLAIAWSFTIAFNLVAVYGTVTLWREGAVSAGGLNLRLLIGTAAMFGRRFRPLLTVPLADQANIVLERLLASGSAVGALASLDYARTLTESTFILISQPLGYVVLTRAPGDPQAVGAEVGRISGRMLALGVPISVFAVIFAPDIVRTVFARGAFDAHAVELTAGALRGISLGLWASMLGWVLVRMINAAGRHSTSAAIIVAAYVVNAAVNIVAVPLLGTLGLGLGEAARGVTLLGASAVNLGCGRLMLRCAWRAAVGAAVLACAGAAVCAVVDGSFARLAVGAPVFGLGAAVWMAMLMPEATRHAAAYIRRQPRRLAAAGWRRP
jgi:putative peptidoglycan lipid II flippase